MECGKDVRASIGRSIEHPMILTSQRGSELSIFALFVPTLGHEMTPGHGRMTVDCCWQWLQAWNGMWQGCEGLHWQIHRAPNDPYQPKGVRIVHFCTICTHLGP